MNGRPLGPGGYGSPDLWVERWDLRYLLRANREKAAPKEMRKLESIFEPSSGMGRGGRVVLKTQLRKRGGETVMDWGRDGLIHVRLEFKALIDVDEFAVTDLLGQGERKDRFRDWNCKHNRTS